MKKIFLLLLLFQLVGCGLAPNEKDLTYAYEGGISVDQSKATAMPARSEISMPRMLIKTGNLSMCVDDLNEAKTQIGKIVADLGAYTSEEHMDNYGDRINMAMTIRVPSTQYDSLVERVEKTGVRTDAKSVNVQDVTEEFIDTEARVKTKKELENRYREILRQASTVTDILAVESQLNTVRGEIESMEGRLKYLSSQVSFSTLHLSFYQSVDSDFGFAGQFADGLENGWTNLLSFMIGLANVWPFLMLTAGAIWALIRWRRRRKIATMA